MGLLRHLIIVNNLLVSCPMCSIMPHIYGGQHQTAMETDFHLDKTVRNNFKHAEGHGIPHRAPLEIHVVGLIGDPFWPR